jgi:RNA polymerase sigma-54 factor
MSFPTLQTRQRQQHTVTPRLQHAVRLLQLSSLDFAQEVQEAMGRNPFLEVEDSPPDAGRVDVGPANGEGDGEARGIDLEATAPIADAPYERESWQQSSSSVRQSNTESDVAALDMIAADVGLRQHLHGQINVLPLNQRDHALACAIVESLDDDGYLRVDLDEIAATSGMNPAVETDEMQIALKLVQALDPPGVAARNVGECLLLQLPQIEDAEVREVARAIVAEHLDRLAQHDVNGLARLLKKTPAQVEAACERIRHLSPRPGWNVEPTATQFITPDVIVRKIRGRWTASLNRAVVPRVKLNQTYASMFQEHRESQHGELAQHLQEARWTVKNVQQRFSTILMVAEAILKRQQHFLEFGPMAMKPLGLREIATELGLHESTVSRVTNNKYMATPVGVFELKYFFSREMATASGGACSATAIRGVIKGMIDAENPADPLSDAQIARLLVRQGLKVARRTVTKYRQLLKVPSVERRRRIGRPTGDAVA